MSVASTTSSGWDGPNVAEATGPTHQSRRPSAVTKNFASPSGRFGESTRRAIREPALDLRKYKRNVEA